MGTSGQSETRHRHARNMPNPIATFTVSGGATGSFKAEIYLDKVPITASNFIDLAKTGFYNGVHFHRVIPGFMDQFGCPNARDPNSSSAGQGGPPDGTFKNLVSGATESRTRGGNIKDENSGGSQFFLNVANNANLDWFSGGQSKHPVFGKIIDNYDLCVEISKVKTRNDNPVNPVKMESITIEGI